MRMDIHDSLFQRMTGEGKGRRGDTSWIQVIVEVRMTTD